MNYQVVLKKHENDMPENFDKKLGLDIKEQIENIQNNA